MRTEPCGNCWFGVATVSSILGIKLLSLLQQHELSCSAAGLLPLPKGFYLNIVLQLDGFIRYPALSSLYSKLYSSLFASLSVASGSSARVTCLPKKGYVLAVARQYIAYASGRERMFTPEDREWYIRDYGKQTLAGCYKTYKPFHSGGFSSVSRKRNLQSINYKPRVQTRAEIILF
jgi:hypothetical protein